MANEHQPRRIHKRWGRWLLFVSLSRDKSRWLSVGAWISKQPAFEVRVLGWLLYIDVNRVRRFDLAPEDEEQEQAS